MEYTLASPRSMYSLKLSPLEKGMAWICCGGSDRHGDDRTDVRRTPLFFSLNSWALGLIIFAIILGFTALGLAIGRLLRHRSDVLREPFAVLQSALLGMIGARPGVRAGAGDGPLRGPASGDGRRGQRDRDHLSPGTDPVRARANVVARSAEALHGHQYRALGNRPRERRSGRGGRCGGADCSGNSGGSPDTHSTRLPMESAPRLYVESLNEMIDMQTTRVAAAREPGAGRRLRARGLRRGRRARVARLLPRILGRGVLTRRSWPRSLVDAPAPRHIRPRPADARPDPGAGHCRSSSSELDGAPLRQPTDVDAPRSENRAAGAASPFRWAFPR